MNYSAFIIAAIISVTPVYASEITGTLASGGTPANATVVVAPTATPAAGSYSSTQNVSLAASGSVSIRYTTDGTDPNCDGGGSLYAGAIAVSSSLTIHAIACYDAGASNVASFAYVISIPENTPSGGGGGGNGPIAGSFGVTNGGGGTGGTSGGTSGSTGGTTSGSDTTSGGTGDAGSTGANPSDGGTEGSGGTTGGGANSQNDGRPGTAGPIATNTPEAAASSSTPGDAGESTSTAAQAAAAGLAGNLGDNWYWWLLFILALIAAGLYWRNRRNQGGQ